MVRKRRTSIDNEGIGPEPQRGSVNYLMSTDNAQSRMIIDKSRACLFLRCVNRIGTVKHLSSGHEPAHSRQFLLHLQQRSRPSNRCAGKEMIHVPNLSLLAPQISFYFCIQDWPFQGAKSLFFLKKTIISRAARTHGPYTMGSICKSEPCLRQRQKKKTGSITN